MINSQVKEESDSNFSLSQNVDNVPPPSMETVSSAEPSMALTTDDKDSSHLSQISSATLNKDEKSMEVCYPIREEKMPVDLMVQHDDERHSQLEDGWKMTLKFGNSVRDKIKKAVKSESKRKYRIEGYQREISDKRQDKEQMSDKVSKFFNSLGRKGSPAKESESASRRSSVISKGSDMCNCDRNDRRCRDSAGSIGKFFQTLSRKGSLDRRSKSVEKRSESVENSPQVYRANSEVRKSNSMRKSSKDKKANQANLYDNVYESIDTAKYAKKDQKVPSVIPIQQQHPVSLEDPGVSQLIAECERYVKEEVKKVNKSNFQWENDTKSEKHQQALPSLSSTNNKDVRNFNTLLVKTKFVPNLQNEESNKRINDFADKRDKKTGENVTQLARKSHYENETDKGNHVNNLRLELELDDQKTEKQDMNLEKEKENDNDARNGRQESKFTISENEEKKLKTVYLNGNQDIKVNEEKSQIMVN